MSTLDELTYKRLKKKYEDDPFFGLYHFVFSESLEADYCNRPELIDPQLAKSIIYETLKLVTIWLDENPTHSNL